METTINDLAEFMFGEVKDLENWVNEQLLNIMTEDQLQASEFKWFDKAYPEHRQMLFAVPNGGERTSKIINGRRVSIEGNKMQATGAKPGVADLLLVTFMSVIFIENKVGTNKQSDDQLAFERKVSQRGFLYFVVYTLEEFKEIIIKALGEPKYG